MTDSTLSGLYRKESNPSLDTMEKIAAAFGKRVEDMLGDTSEVKYSPPPPRNFTFDDGWKIVSDHLATYNDLWDEVEKLRKEVDTLNRDMLDVKAYTGLEDYPWNND